MKRLLSIALALLMALSMLPVFADALPVEDEKALPEVGDVVEGFEVKEVRDFALVGATAVLFEHQKTGAGLMYIANEDTNRVFDLTFLTRPTDNTGLPHVFEHSTLDGSEKYPSKALFFNLSAQTYNTYMNASTYSVMTTYPIASLSEAQLLKYADYYTDSCLHPIVLDDESIFREEAWRYRMASADEDLTIEGTVYSEMQGATTLSRMAGMNAYRAAFPGSVVGLDQGGDPDYIPDMTWESLKQYHELYYHPSNCMAFLYGEFEDYTAFLALLNEAFEPYEKEEFTFVDSGYTPITAPVEETLGFPMEEGSNTENASEIYYYIVCPGLRDDGGEALVLNTLTDLMTAESSALMQSLHKALPSGQFATYIDTTAPDDAIVFVAQNVNADDSALFRETVDAGLKDIAENGFPQDMVDGVMSSLSLSIRLTSEGSDIGTDVIPSIAYSYACSGNPFDYMDYVDALSSIDDWNKLGLYKKAVADWLIDKQTTALVTTYPMPGEKEVKDAALAAKLADVKAGLTDEDAQAIIEASNAVAEEEDTSEMVAQLQAVTVASLPEEVKEYTVNDVTGEDGIRRVDAVAGVEGIGRVAMFLDAKGLPQEDIHFFKLFTDLIGELDTDKHTSEELDVLATRYLYGGEVRLSLMGDGADYQPYLRMGWTGMDEDLAASYDLMYELVFGTQFTDVQDVLDQVQALKAGLRSTINGGAYNVLLYRALSVTNPLYRYYNYINYLDYYAFLENVEAVLQSDQAEAVLAELQSVQAYFNNNTGAVAAFAGSEDSIAVNRPLADAFLAKLGTAPIEHVEYDLPVPAAREALIVDSSVQFNALVADFDALGMEEYDASLDAITTLVSDAYLVPMLRDQYGVYSPWAGAVSDGGVYLLTYRDPNIVETFEVYESLPELIANMDVTQEQLDGYILSSYAYYAKSSGELTGALSAMVSAINGDDPAETIEYMRELKAVTPEAVKASAELYQKLVENGVRSTAGSAAAINANADLYDVILNPFNAKDTSQVEFTDAAEGSEHYEAVRFVYENGLMAPLAEDTFGVDAEATVGDIAAALYVAVGGPAGVPDEAIAFLAQYGIVPADATADTVLTNGMADEIFVNFGQAVGAQLVADEPNETTDLPQTRGELAENLRMLFDDSAA